MELKYNTDRTVRNQDGVSEGRFLRNLKNTLSMKVSGKEIDWIWDIWLENGLDFENY